MIYLSNYILYSGVKTQLHVFSNNLASLPQILLKKSPRFPRWTRFWRAFVVNQRALSFLEECHNRARDFAECGWQLPYWQYDISWLESAFSMAVKTHSWISLWFLLTVPVIAWDVGYCMMRLVTVKIIPTVWSWPFQTTINEGEILFNVNKELNMNSYIRAVTFIGSGRHTHYIRRWVILIVLHQMDCSYSPTIDRLCTFRAGKHRLLPLTTYTRSMECLPFSRVTDSRMLKVRLFSFG